MPIKFRTASVSEPFTFDSIGNHWTQESILRPNGFPHYHYLQTEKGCGRIEIQGKKYLLGEGEGVLIAPFIRHCYSRETLKWTTCFATFTGTLEGSISRMLGSRPVIFTGKEQCSRLSSQLAASMKKFESLPLDETSLSIDCYSVLMCFVEGIYSDSLSQDPLYKRYVAPIIQEIETNFDTGLTVQELSRRVFITPQYLSRLFVRFFGCSTYEYLTTRRINAAKELLIANPQMEIQETARRTGFDAASHFISVFKKTTGMTPGEFRKIN